MRPLEHNCCEQHEKWIVLSIVFFPLVKALPELRQTTKDAKVKEFTSVSTIPVPLWARQGTGSPLGEKAGGDMADSWRQVEEQSSGFGLMMEQTVKENLPCQRTQSFVISSVAPGSTHKHFSLTFP